MTNRLAWPIEIYQALKKARVAQACYVPDAGHGQLIELLHAEAEIQMTGLTLPPTLGAVARAGLYAQADFSAMVGGLCDLAGIGNPRLVASEAQTIAPTV